ncbi:MAG TPA: tRNA (adenosine(37)-N6)-dimethylallyltransferase MiaA [Candidatus Limnocylindrales bacterium]|nr:tRNA (adenosine(37)-N6)-dimethylallyltransferase MiaA [Candidatus Limnocylindrales bacterium]
MMTDSVNTAPEVSPLHPSGGPEAAPLVAIVGPTASGKSTLGVWLAEQLNGEIVVCDSTQVYRGFDIGTSKPTQEEMRRVPHHLIDILEPSEVFTAGEYRERAIGALNDLRQRKRLPLLTAGTGLYLRALLEGLAELPVRSEVLRAQLRARAERNKPGYLHRVLARMDPTAAGRIAAGDMPKLIRAIEICVLSGKPITEVHKGERARLEGFRPVKIGLMPPRTALYERIERRTIEMMDRGWLAEVRTLIRHGIPATSKPFSFIGYGDLRSHLEGKCDLPHCVSAIQQATRRYAKRQITWFRKEQGVHWLEGFGEDRAIMRQALQHLREELGEGYESANHAGAGR